MFDVEWKPKDFEEKRKLKPAFGGYHHYSVSNYEDVDGFCEWLRYQGATDIKVIEHIPYTPETVKEKRGSDLTETEIRNIQLVKKIAEECNPGNIPYSVSDINDMGCDVTKPILICIGGDYYPLEHAYVLEEDDLDDEDKELAGCLVLEME